MSFARVTGYRLQATAGNSPRRRAQDRPGYGQILLALPSPAPPPSPQGERVSPEHVARWGEPPSKHRLCERNASVACRPSPWGEGNAVGKRVGEGWTGERSLCSLRLTEGSTTRCHSSGSKSRSDHSPLTSHHSPAARVLRRCALTLVVLLNFIALPSHADARARQQSSPPSTPSASP